MKSYYKFLETAKPLGENLSVKRKPVFRSSAIFPVLHNPSFTTRISLMGYWLVKRQIAEISILGTLRSRTGEILLRKSILVHKAQAFSFEIGVLLQEAAYAGSEFEGSLELEVFSTRNLFMTYPAIVLCYYNENFSSAVHTTGRIYNDIEDLRENEETCVPEAGFDIYSGSGYKPFVAFTNGPIANPSPELAYTVVADDRKEYAGTISLPPLAEYETRFVYFDEFIELENLLKGRPGTIKIKHNLKGFFPRLISGNFDVQHRIASITHTYYDCTEARSDQDYWVEKNPASYEAAIQIPLFLQSEDSFTDIVFYPIYSPSRFELLIKIFDEQGSVLTEIPQALSINAEKTVLERLSFDELLKGRGVPADRVRSAALFFGPLPGSRLPTRIKMGLNVGLRGRGVTLPCNICFAPKVGNPDAVKSRSFHWAPLLNVGDSVVVITNTAAFKDYSKAAMVDLSFFRETDDEVLSRRVELPPHGHCRIAVKNDAELKAFFQGRTGWVTAESQNPYVYGWYFDFHASGAVAGDHAF